MLISKQVWGRTVNLFGVIETSLLKKGIPIPSIGVSFLLYILFS
jgi:hypothetical protein